MPYKVIAVKGGYKVKSEDGTLLSKKPLTEDKAKKQLIAVNIAYAKSHSHK